MKRSAFLLPLFALSLTFAGCAVTVNPDRLKMDNYSYTPKPMASPEAAIGTLRNMQTAFVPFLLGEGKKITHLEVDVYGLRAAAEWMETTTGAQTTRQHGMHIVGNTVVPYFGSSTQESTSQEQKADTLVIPFDEVWFRGSPVSISNHPNMRWAFKWSVGIPLEGGRSVLVRFPDEYSAQKFTDAVATLAMARRDLDDVKRDVPPAKAAASDAKEEYGGIGAPVRLKDDIVIVVAVYDGYPAQKAGILVGDHVLKIDDLSAKGMTSQEVASLVRGRPGTRVTLTIMRQGFETPREFTITRALIDAE